VSISRRAFLGAAALSPLAVNGLAAPGKLPARAFGRTGVQVPLLAFGCVVFTTCAVAGAVHWLLGWPWAEKNFSWVEPTSSM
jgi:NhaP-type Na+/H+ or K+/H+ antiporter